jgi:molecular chaperone GrpE
MNEEINISESKNNNSETIVENPDYEGTAGIEQAEQIEQKETISQEETVSQEIEKLKRENEKLKDQLLRKVAEFENYRKRTERDVTLIISNANERLILQILPVLDDMERFLKATNNTSTETVSEENSLKMDKMKQGIELIYNKFTKILEAQGVKAIESVGKTFDVDLHEALMQIENSQYEPNTVIEEHEKGYTLNDKVIRHAKVILSK